MIKIGHSYDTHTLVKDRDLFLGGIKIDHHLGLAGHSDADVLLHAITESIIGALGLGDLGTFFPDTDPKFKGIDSATLLKEIDLVMKTNGFKINNLDCIVFAQKPKLLPYRPMMKKNIASILDIDEQLVNIKSTTGEKVGIIGREEAISAECVVLITNG